MIVEDSVFFWSHKTLHHPKVYRYIHKQHHEYRTTVGIAAEYAHPLEYVMGNIMPMVLGPKILAGRCHVFTFWLWLMMRIGETIDGHCGYDFSWSPYRLLPFSGGANYHDYHHSHNTGNFASFFTIWDTICGSNTNYFRFLNRKE
jgi:sterol desaturase/sphingolipid hydroxylase (fatty acid hydroxylase superfamily)